MNCQNPECSNTAIENGKYCSRTCCNRVAHMRAADRKKRGILPTPRPPSEGPKKPRKPRAPKPRPVVVTPGEPVPVYRGAVQVAVDSFNKSFPPGTKVVLLAKLSQMEGVTKAPAQVIDDSARVLVQFKAGQWYCGLSQLHILGTQPKKD